MATSLMRGRGRAAPARAPGLLGQTESAPVLEQIKELALQHLHSSLLGKALHYVTAQWPKLGRYVVGGR